MKKNLLSIIMIALLVMNLALTSVMMFSVLRTSGKTSALVGDIATVLNLELGGSKEEEETQIPLADVENYSIPDTMTILLKSSPPVEGEENKGSKDRYAMVSVVLYMNTKDAGYKKYHEDLNNDVLKSLIIEAVGQFTAEEFRDNTEEVYAAILKNIQTEFDSEFIFKVAFSDKKIG